MKNSRERAWKNDINKFKQVLSVTNKYLRTLNIATEVDFAGKLNLVNEF